MRAFIESAVRAMIAGQRLIKIIGPMSIFRAVKLLSIEPGSSQIVIEQSGKNFVSDDRSHGRAADVNLATRMMRRVKDCSRREFRLKNRWHGLRLARQA